MFIDARSCGALFLATLPLTAATARGQCPPGHARASDGAADDQFGSAVAVDGDTAVVGAMLDNTPRGADTGSAYIFERSGSAWTEQVRLVASNGLSNDRFGYAVAISGDTVVVGAFLDNTAAGTDAGSAYVFERSGGVWSETARLLASDGAPGDQFGCVVALSGDTIVVGAITDDTAVGNNAGSAYVFERIGGVWTETARLFASDAAAQDQFATWLALSGDTIIVGAQQDDTPAGVNAGSAYVFVRSGGVWTEQAHLVASDAAEGDRFGYDVDISGDTAIIGAFADDTAGGTDAGSVYVFVRSGGVWTEQAHLFASDGAAEDYFSSDVVIAGDTAVVSAYLDDTAGGLDAGSSYVFKRSGGVWTEHDHLFAADGAGGDSLGYYGAIFADTFLVGALLDNTDGGTDAGSMYSFDLACCTGDVDGDADIDLDDLLLVLGAFDAGPAGDADGDGDTDLDDLLLVLGGFGLVC